MLHNEKLQTLYYSPNIIMMIIPRRMRSTGHVACMGEMRNPFNIIVGKLEEERRVWRPRSVNYFWHTLI
jgi:hypothetical protein